jgi:hypothetical protein
VIVVAVLLAACTSSGGSGGGADLSSMCTRTCSTCTSGSCYVPTGTAGYQAFCGYPCGVTSDCPDPLDRCTQLLGQPMGKVCVSTSSPKLCEGLTFDPSFTCNLPSASCVSGMILSRPFILTGNQVCGTEFVFCPNGCNSQLSPPDCN